MAFYRAADGKLYGTIECLLIREVDGRTETLIGSRSPWGGIMVAKYGSRSYVEEPAEWWELQGFTITMPAIWREARRLSRAKAAEVSS